MAYAFRYVWEEDKDKHPEMQRCIYVQASNEPEARCAVDALRLLDRPKLILNQISIMQDFPMIQEGDDY